MIKRVKKIPEEFLEQLTEDGVRDFSTVKEMQHVVEIRSYVIFACYKGKRPAFLVGVMRPSYIGAAREAWLLPCKAFDASLFRFSRKGLQKLLKIFGPLFVRIEKGADAPHRFIKALGFTYTEENGNYLRFDRRA